MRISAMTLAVLAVALLFSFPVTGQSGKDSAQQGTGSIRGAVVDGSGGVLPGVIVVATGADRQPLATAVTDGSGEFTMAGLPSGSVTLLFRLDGFADSSLSVPVRPGAESRVTQHLSLASLSETVVVRAPVVVEPPRPRFDPPPPPPPLVARPLPEHDRAAVCGPAKPDPHPESLGTIKSRVHEVQGQLYLAGAELDINGGAEEGLLVGRNLVVRRYYRVRTATGGDARAERTLGVLQIVTASAHTSVALVVYACDAMMKGDFLASFKPEPARVPDPAGGAPAYYEAARILFADEGQTLGVPDRMMVIDRGARQGVYVGQRFTLFRELASRRLPSGDAIVVSVRSDSATIRIDRVTDAVTVGDWAAPQSSSRTALRQ